MHPLVKKKSWIRPWVDMVTSSQDLSIILIIHSLEKLTKAFHKQSLDYTVNVPGSFFYYFLGKINFASPFLLLPSIFKG